MIWLILTLILAPPLTIWSHLYKRGFLWKQYYDQFVTIVDTQHENAADGDELEMVQASQPYSANWTTKEEITREPITANGAGNPNERIRTNNPPASDFEPVPFIN